MVITPSHCHFLVLLGWNPVWFQGGFAAHSRTSGFLPSISALLGSGDHRLVWFGRGLKGHPDQGWALFEQCWSLLLLSPQAASHQHPAMSGNRSSGAALQNNLGELDRGPWCNSCSFWTGDPAAGGAEWKCTTGWRELAAEWEGWVGRTGKSSIFVRLAALVSAKLNWEEHAVLKLSNGHVLIWASVPSFFSGQI